MAITIALLICDTGVLRAGAVYKSVDAAGHVVYSDQPDMSVPQTRVEIADSNSYSELDLRTQEPPPPLQETDQPPCPVDGYLWTPGFWAWSDSGFYWVAGDWVPPARMGLLWTPGYWEYIGDAYVFHPGYWAPDVGYYGGVDYGYGYFGAGYVGGRWAGNVFAYNRTVSNVGGHNFRNVYSEPINHSGLHSRVSYFGGPGGATRAPTAQERAQAGQSHLPATAVQRQSLVQAVPVSRPSSSMVQSARPVARSYAAQPYVQPAATHARAPAARSAATTRAAGQTITLTR